MIPENLDVFVVAYLPEEGLLRPVPYLSAAPMRVAGGGQAGKYMVVSDLQDPAYKPLSNWLETNGERILLGTWAVYEGWLPGVSVDIGDRVAYNGQVFSVLQAHTTQADWPPDTVPALFKEETPAGVIPEWKQPAGAHDAYNTGDKVLYDGQTWESVIDANVWAPGVYGWVMSA